MFTCREFFIDLLHVVTDAGHDGADKKVMDFFFKDFIDLRDVTEQALLIFDFFRDCPGLAGKAEADIQTEDQRQEIVSELKSLFTKLFPVFRRCFGIFFVRGVLERRAGGNTRS